MKRHQQSAQYCKVENLEVEENLICRYCSKEFTNKYYLSRHNEMCKAKPFKEEVEEVKTSLEEIKLKLGGEKQKLEKKLTKVTQKLQEQENCIKEKDEYIKELERENIIVTTKGEVYKEEYEKQINKPRVVNNITINNKLESVKCDNIRPLTEQTIKESIINGEYSYDLYRKKTKGLVTYIMSIIKFTNSKGEVEQNYTCTDSARNKFHRLVKPKKWLMNIDATFLNTICDILIEKAEEYWKKYSADYTTRVNNPNLPRERKEALQTDFDKQDEFHKALTWSDHEKREVLFLNIRRMVKENISI